MWGALRFLRRTFQLIGNRKLTPEKVLALQQARFRQLLRYAASHSSFYRERFRGLDLQRCRVTDLPPLRKAEMMARLDDIVTDPRITRAGLEGFMADPENLGTYYLGRYAVCHTSGSQGQPALIVQDRRDVLLPFAVQAARGQRVPRNKFKLVGRWWRPTRLAIITQRPGFYPSGSFFTYLTSSRLPFVDVLRLSVFDPLPETVARLNEFRPTVLSGYTSGLETLAREELAGRLRLRETGALEQITNLSEQLPPTARAYIEGAFGVHIADTYLMAECLALSSGCPVYPGSHLNADLACLEVVDDDHRPVPDGTAGTRVLVTNLYNRVQPLIRYEVGDVVTMSPTPCSCGSNLPLIQSIEGRTKEQFWIQVNGGYRELPYYVFLAALHHCLDLAEHQVIQTGRNHFVVRVAPLPGKTLSAERIRRLVDDSVRREGLSGLFDLDVEVVPELRPDPHSGKMKRIQNLVGPPPGATEHAADSVLQSV